ncbi:hypothetical protein GALMADRAFT_141400 [Galerina marginata CBS 339.88]|uniref:AB hydrolase-1 domain-containing protein n=1 Tax=Galerina marginata (strain CBS 339.88) TaxID=685588 RepID=A0A067STT5_GALM3|nr:hypothetical protein GALMADRAFT_141400 [Galerina marginata CBS 339.88]
MPPKRSTAFIAACSLLGIFVFLRAPTDWRTAPDVQSFTGTVVDRDTIRWDQIPPSKKLVWQNCAAGRQCARLTVPLNHSNPEGDDAVIALVRVPSAFSKDPQRYRGPILINPGGPGGSGVDMVLGPTGNSLSTIVGPQFDVVGFDPRGIGRSTPRISFFKTDAERALWDFAAGAVVNNSDEGVARTWARGQVIGQLAAGTDDGYLKHMNTDQTARDMLSIVEAHGRSKLQFWGFSYGTILGATFASMFPDKIERMVIDGVADAEDYYSDRFSTSLIDTDKVLNSFFTGCFEAGPEICQFWAPSADDIQKNLTTLFESVRSRPVPVKFGSTYGILDYSKLRVTVFQSLYAPFRMFPILAQGLAELAAGDGNTLFSLFRAPPFECACDQKAPTFGIVEDASLALLCNDGEVVPSDLSSAEEHLERMMKVSQWGEVWSAIRINCAGWPKLPKARFRGPFEAKTSHPILLIGNTADPVTPLWAAKNMSRGFEGSVVLQQNSSGHCSVSAPSVCTQLYVRKYFEDGTLPPAGTVCEVVGKPFPDSVSTLSSGTTTGNDQAVFMSSMTAEERELYAAVLELTQTLMVHFPL